MVENAIKELSKKEYDSQCSYYNNCQFTLTHNKLNKSRLFKGKNLYEVYQKALLQAKVWDEMWEKRCQIEKMRSIRERSARDKESKKNLAITKTKEAEKFIEDINDTLLSAVGKDCKIN